MDLLWHTIVIIGVWLPMVLLHSCIFGRAKIFFFGPIAVWLLTAYATFLVLRMTGVYSLAILSGLIMASIASAFLAWTSLRLESDSFGIISLAFHLTALSIVLTWTSLTRGSLGIPQIPVAPFPSSTFGMAISTMSISVLWLGGMVSLMRSKFGRRLTALGEHPAAAAALGVRRSHAFFFIFFLFGLAALTSVVPFIQYLGILHPNEFSYEALVFLIMMVVAGRPGSIAGATASTVFVVVLREAIRLLPLTPSFVGPVRLLCFGVLLFAAVCWRRESLFPPTRSF